MRPHSNHAPISVRYMVLEQPKPNMGSTAGCMYVCVPTHAANGCSDCTRDSKANAAVLHVYVWMYVLLYLQYVPLRLFPSCPHTYMYLVVNTQVRMENSIYCRRGGCITTTGFVVKLWVVKLVWHGGDLASVISVVFSRQNTNARGWRFSMRSMNLLPHSLDGGSMCHGCPWFKVHGSPLTKWFLI